VQEQQCTNHAKPSLRSGADLKVKPMLCGRRLRGAQEDKEENATAYSQLIRLLYPKLPENYAKAT